MTPRTVLLSSMLLLSLAPSIQTSAFRWFHRRKPVPETVVISIQDPAVLDFCHRSMSYIRAEMDDRPDLAATYLIPTAKDVWALSNMTTDDAGYSDLLARVKYEMWQIQRLDEDSTI